MVGEGGEDRRELLDDLAQTPEATEARQHFDPMPLTACEACGVIKPCSDIDGYGAMVCQDCVDDHLHEVSMEQMESIRPRENWLP